MLGTNENEAANWYLQTRQEFLIGALSVQLSRNLRLLTPQPFTMSVLKLLWIVFAGAKLTNDDERMQPIE